MKAGKVGNKGAGVWHVLLTLFLLVCILLLGLGLLKYRYRLSEARGHGDVVTESFAYTESAGWLDNPNRGFYYMHGFRINDEETDYREELAQRFCRDDQTSLTMIQINLQYYKDGPISEEGLRNLENLFAALETVDKQLIVRFLYDWDGENAGSEPKELDIILGHMRQTGPILRAHQDKIFTLQGLFIGNWGEMNGTKYASQEDMQALAQQLFEATGGDSFLGVRMPMQWRMVTGLKSASEVQNGSLASRLGLYNDGMLGSWSDYGTYGDQTRQEHGYFTYWNREEELEFQEELCRRVPMGGEVIVDNSYNDLDNALADMKRMHVTYINKDFDRNVLDKWAQGTVSEEGCFAGMDGLSYIERHLGYRLLIRHTALAYQLQEDELSVDVTLQNVGFAPVYRPARTQVLLIRRETGEAHAYTVENDLERLSGGNETELLTTLQLELSLAGETAGLYEVYLEITDEASGERILLANEQEPDEYGYRIGTVELQPVEGQWRADWLREAGRNDLG